MVKEEEFRRLLGWYPRVWRERNAEVVLGTMLDVAEQAGRESPDIAERWSALGHGLGFRMGRRFAVTAVILALVCAITLGALFPGSAALGDAPWFAWTMSILSVFLGPAFVALAWIALARERGFFTEPRALILGELTVIAWALAALESAAWFLGFDAADQGLPVTGLAAAGSWIFIGAWVVGAVAVAIACDALLRRTRLHPIVVAILSMVYGAVVAAVLGLSVNSPYTVAVAAVVTGFVVAGAGKARSADRAQVNRAEVIRGRARGRGRVPVRARPPRIRQAARLLATLSAVVGVFGVVYALSGSTWGATQDGTEAMVHGITVLLIAAIPLLAAVGLIVTARGRIAALHTWGPLTLIALAFGAVIIAYQGAPSEEAMMPGLEVGSFLEGAAITWWAVPRLPGTSPMRLWIAGLIGAAYAVTLGIFAAPMLVFVLPILATVIAVWTPGRPPRVRVAPNQSALT